MSVSTSPSTCGNSESSSLASPKTTLPEAQSSCFLPSLSLGELADPVALIDARIKVKMLYTRSIIHVVIASV